MNHSLACLLLLATTAPQADAEPAKIDVGEIRIEVEPALRGNWDFSDFRLKGTGTDLTVEGIAVRRRDPVSLYRWYGYDREGVKIAEGPLGYQDYLKGEKTLIEMHLGERAKQIKRIKIAAR